MMTNHPEAPAADGSRRRQGRNDELVVANRVPPQKEAQTGTAMCREQRAKPGKLRRPFKTADDQSDELSRGAIALD